MARWLQFGFEEWDAVEAAGRRWKFFN